MAAIYANENFPRRVVEVLRRLDHDVRLRSPTGLMRPFNRSIRWLTDFSESSALLGESFILT